MKKTTLTLTSLGLLAILSCWLVFHVSCKKEDDCSGCYLTDEQKSFLIGVQGQKVIFKNDTTGIFDTLCTEGTFYGPSNCSSPCDNQPGSVATGFTFSHLSPFGIHISSSGEGTPFINFTGGCNFNLDPPTQNVTVNSTTYNDVYSMQIDSTKISNAYKQTVPWKSIL